MMVQEPAMELRVSDASHFHAAGKQATLIHELSKKWFHEFAVTNSDFASLDALPIRLELIRCPSRHSGFGSGTQLSFSVASALFEATGIRAPSTNAIASAFKRGRRSAIGSHGFQHGGFLVDRGISPSDNISPLLSRTDFPTQWRIVLITPRESIGKHGKLETLAFDQLISESNSMRGKLFGLCMNEIVPAIAESDYDRLGKPLFEFNRLSGEYFAEYQYGCYHDLTCSKIVNHVRQFGVDAVGQSSWGPCIFAITKSNDQANDLVQFLSNSCSDIFGNGKSDIVITTGNNHGSQIRLGSKVSTSNVI